MQATRSQNVMAAALVAWCIGCLRNIRPDLAKSKERFPAMARYLCGWISSSSCAMATARARLASGKE
jgi:hypothetical protein